MSYALGYTLGPKDLFFNFNKSKLKFTSKECEELFNHRHREIIVDQVFKYALSLIVNDIIENNEIFNLPTGKKKAYLKMKVVENDKLLEGISNGKWEDIDLYSSMFRAYQLMFEYQNRDVFRQKLVYLHSQHRDRIMELTNQGKNYY